MSMRDYDPRGEMLSLREAMNRLLEDSFVTGGGLPSPVGGLHMPLDLYETRDALIVRTSMPGVRPDDIDITVTGDTLTIRGEVPEHSAGAEMRYHQREHRAGSFARSITLPMEVQPDKVEATFEHGVLTLTMPKAERMRPKQIKITTRGGATSVGTQAASPAIEGQATAAQEPPARSGAGRTGQTGAAADRAQAAQAAGPSDEAAAAPSGASAPTAKRTRKKSSS